MRISDGSSDVCSSDLLQNAVDAIAGREGSALPRGRVVLRLGQEDSGLIAIAVEDNGKGLPGENRERLTEPYFTTRSKGTGLGLAIVKKIMEDHSGRLLLEDAEQGGARVRLELPGSLAVLQETSETQTETTTLPKVVNHDA